MDTASVGSSPAESIDDPPPDPPVDESTVDPPDIILDELVDDASGGATADQPAVPVVPAVAAVPGAGAPPDSTEAAAPDGGDGDADEPADQTRLDALVEMHLNDRFREELRSRIDDGYVVRNRSIFHKVWNNVTDPYWAAKTGQCGEFADWGAEWSRSWVTEMLGEGTVVDTISMNEKSSLNPQGILEHVDALIEVNHAATRVIAPDGQRYVLDYWEHLGRSKGHPSLLLTEAEWIQKWEHIAGSEPFVMRSGSEEAFKRFVASVGEERAAEVFISQMAHEGRTAEARAIINSWQRAPW